jgi:hypothetical protein
MTLRLLSVVQSLSPRQPAALPAFLPVHALVPGSDSKGRVKHVGPREENASEHLDALLDFFELLQASFKVGQTSNRTFLILIQSRLRFRRVKSDALLRTF